jgi:hypothetical protein
MNLGVHRHNNFLLTPQFSKNEGYPWSIGIDMMKIALMIAEFYFIE